MVTDWSECRAAATRPWATVRRCRSVSLSKRSAERRRETLQVCNHMQDCVATCVEHSVEQSVEQSVVVELSVYSVVAASPHKGKGRGATQCRRCLQRDSAVNIKLRHPRWNGERLGVARREF